VARLLRRRGEPERHRRLADAALLVQHRRDPRPSRHAAIVLGARSTPQPRRGRPQRVAAVGPPCGPWEPVAMADPDRHDGAAPAPRPPAAGSRAGDAYLVVPDGGPGAGVLVLHS